MKLRANHPCLSLALLFAGFLCLPGCGSSGPPTYTVSGSVSLDGEPVKDGFLAFYPTDTGKDADTTKIAGGKYELKMEPGPKKVEITASREIVPKKIGPMGGPEMEQYIPAKFNTKSDLKAEVEKKAKNEINFELKSK